jgi:hypothetical protein
MVTPSGVGFYLEGLPVRVARMEMRREEAALVVMAEGDDNARNG